MENKTEPKRLFNISYGPRERYLYSAIWASLALPTFAFSFRDFHHGRIWDGLIAVGFGAVTLSSVASYWLQRLDVTTDKIIYYGVLQKRELFLADIKYFFYGIRFGTHGSSFLVLETEKSSTNPLKVPGSLVAGHQEFHNWLVKNFKPAENQN